MWSIAVGRIVLLILSLLLAASGARSRLRMSSTMRPTAMDHMVLSSRRPHAEQSRSAVSATCPTTPTPWLFALRTFHHLSLIPDPSLSDDLVRQHQEVRGHRDPERFGGLEVDDQLELHRLLYRQVGGLGAFQNAIHVGGRALV